MTITHARGSYLIEFAFDPERLPQDRIILTDENLHRLYGEKFGFVDAIVVAHGESSKSLEVYSQVVRELAKRRASRKTTLVAFGGGVVGDLGGFVAATYMRGVPFVQVPTSLLAMVDSSVGGKVGIDLPEGKNLVGAFWPPQAVYIDLAFLHTLPAREVNAGMAEVWKYGYILDRNLLDRLEDSKAADEDTIRRCIELKAQVVEMDEFETNGERAKLNFGHTIGHAVEASMAYEGMLHGEAIAIGMVAEARLGEHLGFTEPGTAKTVRGQLERQGLPTQIPPQLDAEQLLVAMYRDKKATGGKLAFSLVPRLGECKLIPDVPESAVRWAIEQ